MRMADESQLARAGLFEARVPRYTSYPTAPHFSSTAVGAGEMRGWLAEIAPGSEISLYIHVPFCRRLCWFCACRTQGTTSDDPVVAYVDTLIAELALLKDALPEGVTLSRLHWGGGTPTLLPAPSITRLARAVFAVAPMSATGEFSVEIDPNEIDDARLAALAEAGMNRASIGVQDFDPMIQKTIGREQSFDITQSAADKLRAHGIRSLNADILFGLPHQTNERIATSIQQLLTLNPDRIALYGYAHVPWMARRQVMIPSDALPRPEERLALFETARKLLVWDGYEEIGIDHFARPEDGLAVAQKAGLLRRNFQGYTDDTAPVLVGLGASSISRFPQGYAQNAPGTSQYVKAVRSGSFATARGHVFKGEDLLRARLIEALMCDFRIDAGEICRTFGLSPAALKEYFAPVSKEFGNLVVIDHRGLEIPPESRPLTRMIARLFDAYAVTAGSHSHAV